MMTCGKNTGDNRLVNEPYLKHLAVASKASRLQLVTEHDLQDLCEKLHRGQVPPDLEAKLSKLANGNLVHRSIEQNCRSIIALLQAVEDGAFKEATPEDCERLLRVLAYVRKDEDAIADYRIDGFTDDQQELRVATTQLSSLLQTFKSWRLRYQVPAMWQSEC